MSDLTPAFVQIKTQKAQSEDWAFTCILWVADGARVHDNRNHNPAVKQPFPTINQTLVFFFPTTVRKTLPIHAGFKSPKLKAGSGLTLGHELRLT